MIAAREGQPAAPAVDGQETDQLAVLWALVATAAAAAVAAAPRWVPGTPACPVRSAAGIPCPGCGTGRALLLVAGGRPLEALLAHPSRPSPGPSWSSAAWSPGRSRSRGVGCPGPDRGACAGSGSASPSSRCPAGSMPSSPASEAPPAGEGRSRVRRRLLATLALLVAIVALDASRPPERQWLARAALGAIDLYQATLSSRLPAVGVSCRYEPTCSRYTEAAIREDGGVVGILRGLGRILSCGPWVEAGTVDPP